MKNIIFLTDFSDNADNALEYLADLSNQIGECNIYIIHTYTLAAKTGMFLSVKERMREDATALLINRRRKLEKLTNNSHYVFTKAIYGELSNVIAKLENQLGADLILTSTRGDSTSPKNLIGPNAGAIVKKTTSPVLLVPPTFKYAGIKRITLGIKQPRIAKKKTVGPLKKIKATHSAKIRVLLTDTDDKKISLRGLHLKNYVSKISMSSEDSLYKAIMKDHKSKPADLLCVIRRKHGFFEKWFKSGSYKRSLFDINIPILVLRGEE